MIRINGLHKFFNKGRQNEIHVINDVTLDLPEQGMVAIFGKSGCGKTTLLNVIGGLDKFASGSLTIENKSITDNTDVIRNSYIGYIFQNYNLNKAETCFDNVADALRLCGMTDAREIKARVMAALANVGMDKYALRTPDTLSGGQQQRIAIARAIVKNPRIILADEPTGNLDEANTVMIMDLLKAIAKDHLVLLVTHEANLVDYYCDTVIELQDGKVIGIKQNESAHGFAARDKNDIYLGELSFHEMNGERAQISYYGDAPAEPIKLTIVNHGGKMYVKLGSSKVQILDDYSEIKLREGVYEEKVNANAVSGDIDMSKLPPFEGKRFGRLFSLRSSLKSGYISNFKNRKKGKKVLRGCMCLFASVVVFMSAFFGTAFGDIINAKRSYNHNVFYVYTPDAKVSSALSEAVGRADTGIDYIRLTGRYPNGDDTAYFRTGSFETFAQYDYESNFRTNAVYLDLSLAKDLPLVEGRADGLSGEEILLSTRVADELVSKSTLGYISERRDLIGLVSDMFSIDGRNARVAGIVECDEPAIYLTEIAMAKYVRYSASPSHTALGSDFGLDIKSGEAVIAMRNELSDVKYPAVGETIKIQGRDILITEVKRYYRDYSQWLEANEISKKDEYAFFSDLLAREKPDLVGDKDAFNNALDAAVTERFYEYLDYYYSEFDAYLKDMYFFDNSHFELWLYVKKGVEEAKYTFFSEEYYKAIAYKDMYGSYPTKEQLMQVYNMLPDVYEKLSYSDALYDEFYASMRYAGVYSVTFLVSEEDYIAFSKQLGETHPSASAMPSDISYLLYSNTAASADVYDPGISYYGPTYYTVIHSNNPDVTASWLAQRFSDLTCPNEYQKALITPDTIFDIMIKESAEDIVTSLVTMAVILILMSVCMYFIMRSSLMSRIKEVGIYRAIGVSKKNLVFKFFVEAAVLTTLTVMIGYLFTGAFLLFSLEMSSLVGEIFFYPLWLAGADLVLLYLISLFFGTLPILSLLRKTPSEILAKYDI